MYKFFKSRQLFLGVIVLAQVGGSPVKAADIAQIAFRTVVGAMKTVQFDDFSQREMTQESFLKDVFNRVVLLEKDRGKLRVFTNTITKACDEIMEGDNILGPQVSAEAERLKKAILQRYLFADLVLRYKELFNNAHGQWKSEVAQQKEATLSPYLPIGKQDTELDELSQTLEEAERVLVRSFYKHYQYQHAGNAFWRCLSSVKAKGDRYLKHGEAIHEDPYLGITKRNLEVLESCENTLEPFRIKTYQLYRLYLCTFSLMQQPEEAFYMFKQARFYENEAEHFEEIFKITIDFSPIIPSRAPQQHTRSLQLTSEAPSQLSSKIDSKLGAKDVNKRVTLPMLPPRSSQNAQKNTLDSNMASSLPNLAIYGLEARMIRENATHEEIMVGNRGKESGQGSTLNPSAGGGLSTRKQYPSSDPLPIGASRYHDVVSRDQATLNSVIDHQHHDSSEEMFYMSPPKEGLFKPGEEKKDGEF